MREIAVNAALSMLPKIILSIYKLMSMCNCCTVYTVDSAVTSQSYSIGGYKYSEWMRE